MDHFLSGGRAACEGCTINNFDAWLKRTTDDASDREIAKRVTLSHVTIGRWRNSGSAPCPGIIRIARAYDADPVDGMIAAGWLTESDLMNGGLRNAVRHAPTAYLTEELNIRVATGRLDGAFDELRAMFRDYTA